jgi:MFS transporter, ACS family, solute carrier family 17 (sodium-dependent inorganic phosphate cotransporter), other
LIIISFKPFVAGILTPNRTLTEWRLVFFVTFGVLVVTNIFYLIFGSGETQDWDMPEERRRNETEDVIQAEVKGDLN